MEAGKGKDHLRHAWRGEHPLNEGEVPLSLAPHSTSGSRRPWGCQAALRGGPCSGAQG